MILENAACHRVPVANSTSLIGIEFRIDFRTTSSNDYLLPAIPGAPSSQRTLTVTFFETTGGLCGT